MSRRTAALTIIACLVASLAAAGGPDAVHGDLPTVTAWGAVDGIRAYSLGAATCNIGDADLLWINRGTPAQAWNAYRLHDGRLTLVGLSFARRFCCAAASTGCGITCNGHGGDVLGVGCRDVSSSAFAGSQTSLSPRSSIDAFNGTFAPFAPTTGDAIFRRLQIPEAVLDPALNAGALYFLEGVYASADDAAAGKALNNAGHRRVLTSPSFMLSFTGAVAPDDPAITAWRTHGLGLGVPDPRVEEAILDVPGEGRFHAACKVTDLGGGRFLYDYAVFNLNSDRGGGSLRVPFEPGTSITNAGFHAPPYHSDEVYDNTPWTLTITDGSVTWSSPETHAENPDSNALRWGTLYNFWFEADRPPIPGQLTLGLFKPHTPQEVPYFARVPGGPASPPGDLDGDGDVDLADLALLLANFGCAAPACTGDVDADGDTDLQDLTLLLANFGR